MTSKASRDGVPQKIRVFSGHTWIANPNLDGLRNSETIRSLRQAPTLRIVEYDMFLGRGIS